MSLEHAGGGAGPQSSSFSLLILKDPEFPMQLTSEDSGLSTGAHPPPRPLPTLVPPSELQGSGHSPASASQYRAFSRSPQSLPQDSSCFN